MTFFRKLCNAMGRKLSRKESPEETARVKLWMILVTHDGTEKSIGTVFRGTREEAKREAQSRVENYVTALVFERGEMVFANYGVKEVHVPSA